MCLASVGHVNSNVGTAFFNFVKTVRSVKQLHTICDEQLIQVGNIFPQNSAVYVRYWCVMFECDGPNLMFVYVFWYVFGFGWACYVNPHAGAACSAFLKNECAFCESRLLQLGNAFTHNSCVYLH